MPSGARPATRRGGRRVVPGAPTTLRPDRPTARCSRVIPASDRPYPTSATAPSTPHHSARYP
ncbi:hypothetical protein ACIPYS_40070, partial [Kitasatospora sp. NPDC089913]|uniref:hypothetical protein n=1 Tax=Kitasatospora sp. NPDC089913 TaxID=3364080 RepID=UPI0037FD601F